MKSSLVKDKKNRSRITRIFQVLLMIFLSASFSTSTVFAESQQNKKISGTVIDTNGEPLIGVNVSVKGTTIGNITDIDGKYILDVPNEKSILVFSYIGYQSKEATVGSKSIINETLSEDTQKLDEVVVVGYGKQKKETVVGSVASVKGTDLIKSPAVNLSNSIAGRLPGVFAFQGSAEPGSDGSTLRIRGSNTLGNNDPLVVIDGVAARTGGMDRLEPADIESMSVLKDASAAIYGARAANGVILITTKRGRQASKPTFSYAFNQGFAQPTSTVDMVDAPTYAGMRNELNYNKVMKNPKLYPDYDISTAYQPWKTDEEIQKYRDGSDPWSYPNTDWYGLMFKNWSPQSHHTASLEGGSETVRYFTTFGYKNEDAFYKKSAAGYKQYNLRVNLDADITKYIKVSLNVTGRQEGRDYPTRSAGDIFRAAIRSKPTDTGFWPNGLPGPDIEFGDNPAVTTKEGVTGYDKDTRYYFQTDSRVDITNPWISGLKISLSASWDKYIKHTKRLQKPWTLYSWDGTSYGEDGLPKLSGNLRAPDGLDPNLKMGSEDQSNLMLNGILSYDKKFGNHTITFLAGIEKEKSNNEFFDAYRRYYLSTAVETLTAGGDLEKNNSGSAWERARLNYFGRLGYNYKEKLLAEFVWRYDGSYMFAQGSRFGFFPGVLLGYRISEENFWKDNVKFMDYLKIRASWGQLGNDQIYYDDALQEYQYMGTYKYAWGYIIDGKDVKGLEIGRFPNTSVTWERANNLNVGLEGRIGRHISFEVDGFYNQRTNILWRRNASVPQSAGLTLPAENLGEVSNRGFDLKVDYNSKVGKDFMYSVSLNGGFAKNKIEYWDEAAGAPEWQKSTGHPMKTDLYYVYDGVFKDWNDVNASRPYYEIVADEGLKPGDMKFKDVDGDGKITSDDRKRFDKNADPTFQGGLNLSLQYKDWDLTVLFQGTAGAWRKVYQGEAGEMGNYSQDVADNHWSATNPSSKHPRVTNRGDEFWGGGSYGNNTYWMRKTDYIRLKNVELGYTVPQLLTKKVYISNLRFYLNGLNLATIAPDFKNYDPEANNDNGGYYPQARIINIGASVTF